MDRVLGKPGIKETYPFAFNLSKWPETVDTDLRPTRSLNSLYDGGYPLSSTYSLMAKIISFCLHDNLFIQIPPSIFLSLYINYTGTYDLFQLVLQTLVLLYLLYLDNEGE